MKPEDRVKIVHYDTGEKGSYLRKSPIFHLYRQIMCIHRGVTNVIRGRVPSGKYQLQNDSPH